MNEPQKVSMFHIALDRDGKLQPISNASLPFGDLELLKQLLSTDRPGAKTVQYNEQVGYLFMYDNNLTRPYPSVMIWRYENRNGQSVVVDVKQEDMRAVTYAVDHFLKLGEA